MAYTKKTWASGDTITSEALNNIENGISALDAKDTPVYQKFVAGADPAERKTIQLANHDSISGVGVDGKGYNLVMLSKWNKCDLGSSGVEMNLNSKDGKVTINDDKEIVTKDLLEALESKVSALEARIEALEA